MPKGSGKVVWKLSDYKSKVEDKYRRTRTPHYVIGPTFYTTGFGYKFGTYYYYSESAEQEFDPRIGVHPVSGVYDAFLKSPFVGKITVTVIDQNKPAVSEKYVGVYIIFTRFQNFN